MTSRWLRAILIGVVLLTVSNLVLLTLLARRAPPAPRPASLDELPLSARPDWEWSRRMDCYVSDRPDLSTPLEAQKVQWLRSQPLKYLEAGGLAATDVQNLRYACADDGTVLSFSVDASRLKRFLSGKKPIGQPVDKLLRALYVEGEATLDDIGGPDPNVLYDLVIGYRNQMQIYPFDRLTWWPIALADAPRVDAYLAYTTWDRGEAHVGSPYLVLVYRDTRVVYMVGLA